MLNRRTFILALGSVVLPLPTLAEETAIEKMRHFIKDTPFAAGLQQTLYTNDHE